jgi:hypothetical protein
MPHCPCPSSALGVSDYIGVDYIDGYPAEMGTFNMDLVDFGFDRGSSDDQDIRDILGLPEASDGSAPLTFLFRLGSGVRVPRGNAQYSIWKGHRLDCDCLKYTCAAEDGDGSAPSVSSTIKCIADFFLDSDGVYDPNPDKISLSSKTILNEDYGVGDGTRLDGSIANLMMFSNNASSIDRFRGITAEGSFANFIDPYGIIHAAIWKITGDQIDITFMTQDPRIPGEAEQEGRVVKVGRSLKVFRKGITTITRQIIKVTNSGLVILGQGTAQEIGEFQATFGCGDHQPVDPFLYHLGSGITDQVEFITDTVIEQDPPDPTSDETDVVWWPEVVAGTAPGFRLYGPDLRPLTELSNPGE